MDPVSHALFGRTLGLAVASPRRRRGVTAALVLGSLLPDIDIALAPRAFETYLRVHASGTHSLVGSIVGAVVLAAVLRGALRGSRYWPLFWASWAGTLGHVFWDVADGGDISVLEPLSSAAFGWHLVAMGEPAVLALLLAAAVFAWGRPSGGRAAAALALAGLVALLAVKSVSQTAARARHAQANAGVGRGDAPSALAIEPVRGSLARWTIYDRADDRLRAWRVDSITGTVELGFERSDAGTSPFAAASRDLPVVRAFLAMYGIPFARIENDGTRRLALWSDIRWCSAAACDVSFGGVFDGAMKPLYQVVQVGGFRQMRPVQ